MPFEKRRPMMAKNKNKPPHSTTDDTDKETPTPGPATAAAAATPNKAPTRWIKGKKRRAAPDTPAPFNPNHATPTKPSNSTTATTPTPLPVHGSQKKGRGGGHNCPSKDAATTHPFIPRCIKQQHAGYCPSCNNLVSFRYGCHNHGWAKEGLSARALRTEELKGPEWKPEDLEARWDGRGRKTG